MTPYVTSALACAAVVASITGEPWDKVAGRPSLFGWLMLAVAVVTMLVSMWSAYHDRTKLHWVEQQRTAVRGVAGAELKDAIDVLLHPFSMLWQNAAFASRDLEFDEQKFFLELRYAVEKLLAPEFQESWKTFFLAQEPKYPSLGPPMTWAAFFSYAAGRADKSLEATTTKYSTYLEAPVLLAVHELQRNRFSKMRLEGMPELLEMNDHRSDLSISFAFGARSDLTEYKHFVADVERLLVLLPSKARV